MKILYIVSLSVFAYLSVGCSTVREIHPLEYTWQAMHVIDILQTANGVAANPGCSEEGNSLTRNLIGIHPEKHEVYKWGFASSILHFFAGKWIDKQFGGSPDHVNLFIRSIDNGLKFSTIHSNHSSGVTTSGYDKKRREACDTFLAKEAKGGNIVNVTWKF